MKTPMLRPFLSLLCTLSLALPAIAQDMPKLEIPVASPMGTLTQRVGVTDIQIKYSRPSMKGRKIFGALVPYDKVWRTGANTATQLSFETPVKLNGKDLREGGYELFTIPGRDEWTIIIHKPMSQWGTYDYDPKNDVVRFKVKPVRLDHPVETLQIGLNDLRDGSATLSIAWENTLVSLALTIDLQATLVPKIETAMAAKGEHLPYASAAMFYYENNFDLTKAAAWMDAAIAANPEAFHLTYRKALILEKMGDKAGAVATAKKSLEAARLEKKPALREEYVSLNEALIKRLK